MFLQPAEDILLVVVEVAVVEDMHRKILVLVIGDKRKLQQ